MLLKEASMRVSPFTQTENQSTSLELVRRKNRVKKIERISLLIFGIGFASRIVQNNWYPARWLDGVVWICAGAFIVTTFSAFLYKAFSPGIQTISSRLRKTLILLGFFLEILLFLASLLLVLVGVSRIIGL
jgi:hypothetical protein